ncbi:MAG: heavy metal-binding domain-containing protein [Acidimicrobiales bacterium]
MAGPGPGSAQGLGADPGPGVGSDTGAFRATTRVRRTPTSDLSVAAAAALRRVGLSPVGFVMGSAVMQLASTITGNVYGGTAMGGGIGWGGLLSSARASGSYVESYPCAHFGFVVNAEHYGFNAENTVLAASLFEGYRLALSRIQDEAVGLGAHGVVGVKLSFEHMVGAAGTATFLATGTAVLHRGSSPLASPFLTNASGQNFERLIGLGYVAAGLAVGVGVVYVQPNCLARGDLTAVGPNPQIPAAVGVARGRARQWLASTAHSMGEGVVHTEWSDRRFVRYGESWNQLALAVGTAVRRYKTEVEPLMPRAIVPLRP